MLDKLTIDDFENLIDRDVTLRFGDNEQAGRVVEVTRRGEKPPEGRQPFSIVVESGPNDGYWPQGTHVMVHPEHGELTLFMVPLGPGDHGMRYEIAIN
jgi:hypothetical protein